MMSTIRVLVADDHESFRSTLAEFLNSQEGVQVVCGAADGQEAIEGAQFHKPDMVILDLNMPKYNGFEASRAIKRQSPWTKVYVISSHEEEIYFRMAELQLADGYLKKSSLKKDIEVILDSLIMRKTSAHAA